jgi:hypothetical protein
MYDLKTVETVSGAVVKHKEVLRKRIIGHGPREVGAADPGWVDLDLLAQIEITSEDVDYPIEAALIPNTGSGWRAA